MERNLKNVLVVSFGILLLFTATGSLQSLQSSLNAEAGMGVASVSTTYACSILSSMFLTPTIIRYLGCKWTIVASMCCNVIYTIGNFFPGWASLITTAVISGLGFSSLMSAASTYLTITGNLQAEKDNRQKEHVINQYFGIFFLLFQSSAVWGNIMSSLIFGQGTNTGKETVNSTQDDFQFCGVGSCGNATIALRNSTRPEDKLVHTLLGCYVGMGVLAMTIVAVFLDNIDRNVTHKLNGNRVPFCSTFLATFKQLKDKRQVLLIPVTAYLGLEMGFLNGDYTKEYVTCALGIHFVGYVIICFGCTSSLFSFVYGKLSQYSGRVTLFVWATITHLACILALLYWRPHPAQLPVFFVFPALWGMAHAVWQTQTNAVYAVLFHGQKEAAFSNYQLWQSVGYAIAFAFSNLLCVDIKLYILMGVLLLSVILCCSVEYQEYKSPTPGAEDTNHSAQEEKQIPDLNEQ